MHLHDQLSVKLLLNKFRLLNLKEMISTVLKSLNLNKYNLQYCLPIYQLIIADLLLRIKKVVNNGQVLLVSQRKRKKLKVMDGQVLQIYLKFKITQKMKFKGNHFMLTLKDLSLI